VLRAQPNELRTAHVVFLMLWPAFPRVGRVTSDVVRGLSVMQFLAVGHSSTIRLPYGTPWLTEIEHTPPPSDE